MTARDTSNEEQILISHGGGGEMTRRLLAEHIVPPLNNELLGPLDDSAIMPIAAGRLAFTTDAFVVQPLAFAGGDIGRLAVCGTVNDLAVAPAIPKALSLALVIEEGLPIRVLDTIVESIARTAREAGVVIATGDTKVVEHRRGDGLIITTAGIGEMRDGVEFGVERIGSGDVVIVSGRIAEHGLAVMSAREGLAFDTELESDVAPLNHLIGRLFETGADIKFLRDPTRGGLAGVLADLAEDTGCSIELDEDAVPLSPVARHTAELLGLDPLTVANEGKVVIVVAERDADRVLKACHADPLGQHAAIVGRLTETQPPLVELLTRAGGRRIVQRPHGEELPRIC